MVQKTALFDQHIAMGAKTGAFAGYDMPLYYHEGALAEHHWVRDKAGLFDVSHMGQVYVTGSDALDFLQTITPSFYESAPQSRAKYTVLLNDNGGIIDDLIVTKHANDCFFLVINAGRKDVDLAYFQKMAEKFPNVRIDYMADRSLMALQGPSAENILRDVLDYDAADQPYMWFAKQDDLYVSRLGYTGEDGFEISVPDAQAADLWQKLCHHDDVKPAGLACRDTLRLEMGYPLYGHDLDENTTPVEAGLGWVVSKNNDTHLAADTLKNQKVNGTDKRRVSVKLMEKGIAREGTEIVTDTGDVIGVLTSGGYSPTLDTGIGQGYIKSGYAATGTDIYLQVRKRRIKAQVSDLSLVAAKTKSMKHKNAA